MIMNEHVCVDGLHMSALILVSRDPRINVAIACAFFFVHKTLSRGKWINMPVLCCNSLHIGMPPPTPSPHVPLKPFIN